MIRFATVRLLLRAGMSSVEWKLEIVADGVQEGNEEKLKLFLENATNAVLGHSADKTQINLIDFEDGRLQFRGTF